MDAIVLTGGRGSRLGGRSKADVVVGGRRLVDITLGAVAAAETVVVVGEDPGAPDVVVVREDPPFGGPVAAIVAGLAALPSDGRVLVLACDMPRVGEVVEALTAAEPAELLVGVDRGRTQYLAGLHATSALQDRIAALGDPGGRAMRDVLSGVTTVELPPGSADDIDTPDDLPGS